MELDTIAKQIIGFQKTVFENSWNVGNALQDSSRKVMDDYMEQFPWLSEECKKSLYESIDLNKKAQEEYKNTVYQGFEMFEELTVVNPKVIIP